MATKWKGWTARKAVKVCCVILIPVMAFIFLLGGMRLFNYDGGASWDILFSDLSGNDYFFDKNMGDTLRTAETVFSYISEDSIRNEAHLEWAQDEFWDGIRYRQTYQLVSIDRYNTWYSDVITELERDGAKGERMINNAIEHQLLQYRNAKNWLDTRGGLYYFITDGERVLSNLPPERQNAEFFLSQPVYVIKQPGGNMQTSVANPRLSGYWYPSGIDMVGSYIAYSQEMVDWQNAQWRYFQQQLYTPIVMMGASAMAALALLIILLIGTGRRYGDASQTIHFTALDKPWLDFGLAALVVFEVLICFVFIELVETALRYNGMRWIVVLCALLAVKFTLPMLWWLTTFTKRCKFGNFWRHTFVYAVFSGIVRFAKSLWAGFPLTVRGVAISVVMLIIHFACIALSASYGGAIGFAIILGVLVPAIYAYIILRHFRKLYLVEQGAKAASEGNYGTAIKVTGGELGSIADSINSISSGINAAVTERMKSERLKTELITNVSHDIRTPLTSLITYTDLLKTEGLDSEKAPEYLEVLIQKSARLKTLTDDLFEASKAASGNISAKIESLDLADFIRQVLGELDERVAQSGLDFRLNLPEHANVLADGKLLWRVMENLLSNVFKYALAGSRVYIDAVPDESFYRIDVKNISEHPLNVEPSELTERFKRGDSARSDEGSGLGLSIAQSFVQAQGGRFALSIDGDLFKASVYLPK